ncbi:hypothetical protein BDN72DRAFT_960006 [Pluteus cervinus]|uniref:Uncharacterized protein n=1 Tax=Pluteus cervinus TaxID=181527 RepID=A0ACD3ASU2_9AGAR|nr:hypothetical protein BDN72DRAFT_960006 [Pluteus cervinus]
MPPSNPSNSPSQKKLSKPRGPQKQSNKSKHLNTGQRGRSSRSRSPRPSTGYANTKASQVSKHRPLSPSSTHEHEPEEEEEDGEDDYADFLDNDEVMASAGTRIDNLPIEDHLRSKGRIIGRFGWMFRNFLPPLEFGIQWDSDEPPTNERQRLVLKTYDNLLLQVPRLHDEINHNSSLIYSFAKLLDFGRRKARGSDIHSIKTNIPSWRKFDPPFNAFQRGSLGFHHEAVGALLCPPNMDWKDPAVKEDLRSKTITIPYDLLPRLLWRNETCNPENVLDGFMEGPLVLKTCRHLLVGPGAAHDEALETVPSSSSGRAGNAEKHGIREVTKFTIAYAATLLRHVLSTQQTFSPGYKGSSSRFPYRDFYVHLVQMMASMREEDLKALYKWYNDRIFGDLADDFDEDSDNILNKPITKGSISEALVQQLKAQREADRTSNSANSTTSNH